MQVLEMSKDGWNKNSGELNQLVATRLTLNGGDNARIDTVNILQHMWILYFYCRVWWIVVIKWE